MPAEYTLETLPEPTDARVKLVQDPGRLMAAIRYSGTWSEAGYEENKTLLEEFIERRGLIKAGEPVWARYAPPVHALVPAPQRSPHPGGKILVGHTASLLPPTNFEL